MYFQINNNICLFITNLNILGNLKPYTLSQKIIMYIYLL